MIILIFIITHHKYYVKNNSYNNGTHYKKAYQASNRLEKVGAKYRDKGVDGYYCEGSRQWEKRHYYHFAYANFDVEFNDCLGELTITADCNARFGIEYDGTDEGDEITREEYINGLKALVTDEAAIEALERAMSADDGDD